MYENYCKARDLMRLKDADVARKTGIPRSTFSDWKSGRSKPKAEKMIKIADFLHTSVEFIETGKNTEKKSDTGRSYYFNDETAQIAQELFENPDTRMLFDAARDAKPEDLKMAADMLRRFKEANHDI